MIGDKVRKKNPASKNPASLHKQAKAISQEITEEKLTASEKRFRLLSEVAEEGIAIHDQGLIIEANQALARMFGYKLSEMIGMHAEKFADPESWKIAREHISKQSDEPYEGIGVKKDGSTFLCSLVGKPFKYQDRMLRVAVFRDLTERKRTEEKLRFEEQRFRALIDHSADIIVVADLTGTITYINPAVEQVLGFKPEERIGRKGFELVHPDDSKFLADSFIALISDTKPRAVKGRIHLRHKNGTYRTLDAVGSNLIKNNVVEGIVVNYRDITEQKEAEDKLRREEQLFRSVTEQSSDVIIVANKEGIITYENPAVEKVLGYKPEDRVGSAGLDFVHPDDVGIVNDARKIIFNDANAPVQKGEVNLCHKDGSWRTFEVTASNLLNNDIIEGAIVTLHDITERKKTEENLLMTKFAMDRASYNILWLNDSAKIIYANDASVASLGYTREELLTMTIHDVDPDFPAKAWLPHVDELRKRRFLTFESRHRKKDGTSFPVEATCNYFEYKDRFYSCAFDRDITEQKKAEELLKKSESQYRLLADHMKDQVWLMDLNLKTTYISPSVEKLWGYTLEDIIALPIDKILTPASLQKAMEFFSVEMSKALAASPNYFLKRLLELEFICKDGRILWIESAFSFIRDENGKPVSILGEGREITERKQIEDALRKSEENFRHTFDDSPLGVRISTTTGETIYANQAILDIYGYDDIEELMNTPLQKRYTPDSYSEYLMRKEKRLRGEAGPSEYEISIVRKNGEIRHLYVFRKEIFWNGKKQSQVVYQDITLRRQTEEKLNETLETLRQSIRTTIQVLGTASEARDPYTAGHQKRVANLARAIATEMKLSHDKIEAIRMAGAIHDIGKISVPSEILCKPALLTDLEFSLIKNHSQFSYEIMKDIESPWPLADIVRQHHERMDGSGYPQGLKDTNILIEARILAVADVVEAMMSYRPYRPALEIEIALYEIETNSGILYDSKVVDACLTLFRDKGYQIT
jgi:PAS domain S-box-containing protein